MLGNPADDGVGDAPAIPIQPATVQPAYTAPLQNTPLLPTPYTIQLPEPVVPLPAPDPLMPAWLPITDLVIGRDSHYQQSDQSPEIQACLSATVRRANANLILLDGFPDPHRKGQWLADALGIELSQRRKASTNIAILDDRARHDAQFFNRLLYMVTRSASIHHAVITTEKNHPRFVADGAHSGRGPLIWRGQLLSLPSHHMAFIPQIILIPVGCRPQHAIFSSRIRIILVKLQR